MDKKSAFCQCNFIELQFLFENVLLTDSNLTPAKPEINMVQLTRWNFLEIKRGEIDKKAIKI